jgi:DNA-binding IclR family transcriptional regulator
MTAVPHTSSVPRSERLSSVAAAARLLKEFDKDARQLGVTQLARRVGISKSAAHRIIWTLVDEGLLEKDEETGLFRLTITMWSLGSSSETVQNLREAATIPLDKLRRFTAGTMQIGLLEGHQVLYIARREGPDGFQVFRSVGSRNLAHVTSSGKVLLAYLPPDYQRDLIAQMRLPPSTPRSITTRAELLAELDIVRRQGWAENRGESHAGMCSIAAPIRDPLGRVIASVSVAQFVDIVDNGLRSLVRPIAETASLISRSLEGGLDGHRSPPFL